MVAFFKEHGPFRVLKDSSGLEDSIFSWNRFSNILYLDSPRNSGFSYADPEGDSDGIFNDTLTAQDNLEALKQFLLIFPEYRNRDFYIVGQSYGKIK